MTESCLLIGCAEQKSDQQAQRKRDRFSRLEGGVRVKGLATRLHTICRSLECEPVVIATTKWYVYN